MARKKTWIQRGLNITEKVGNALPHPATLFALFALITLLFSGILSNLASDAGLYYES